MKQRSEPQTCRELKKREVNRGNYYKKKKLDKMFLKY